MHINQIDEISEGKVMHIVKAESLLNRLGQLEKELSKIDTTTCNEIDQSEVDRIHKLDSIRTKISSIEAKLKELEAIDNYITQVLDYLKQCGVAVETCPKCGEAVIIDIEKIVE